MSDSLDPVLEQRLFAINQGIDSYFHNMELAGGNPVQELSRAMLYSAGTGGKRFRPLLCLSVAELLSSSQEAALPFAIAVEFIHTYSLIHDDLPCMDNDDFRRGKPTNHKLFGEAGALLAGDALLTEAFLIIARSYSSNAEVAVSLVELLSLAAGIRGMVGGQAIDLKAKDFSVQQLNELHHLKTGRLIQVAAEGAAIVAGASKEHRANIAKFGATLGLAFQVADDILDQEEKDQGPRSFVTLLGLEASKKYLNELSQQALSALHTLPSRSPVLENMIEFNRLRKS